MSDEREKTGSDPRAELAAIAAQVAAYVEWQLDTGALGVPRVPYVARAAAPDEAPAQELERSDRVGWVPDPASPVGAGRAPCSGSEADSQHGVGVPPRGQSEGADDHLSSAPAMTIASLPVLAETVRGCTRCALSRSRTHTVFERGNPEAKLAFVGEAPGADEDAQGAPFVGRAGQLLDKMIAAMGLSPERDVYICNIIKCRPPENRRPTTEETATCIPYLHQQLAAVRPKVIVALGNTSVQALLGTTLGITKLRGQFKMYKSGDTSSLVMPTYHPSYLLRPSAQQLEAKRQAWEDLQVVMKELGLSPPARR
jgi:DNA polymerase